MCCLAVLVLRQSEQVNHAVDSAGQPDERAERGDVADFALELGSRRELVQELVPRIGLGLLEAERDAALLRNHVKDLDLYLLAGRHDVAGVDVLLGPANLGDVAEGIGYWPKPTDRAGVCDVGVAAGKAGTVR